MYTYSMVYYIITPDIILYSIISYGINYIMRL